MKEDWTDKLERKLEGYSMEEPEGLWSAIQSSLPAAPAPAAKVHRLRNIFAVAVPSAVAACLGAWLILAGGNDVQSTDPKEGLTAMVEVLQKPDVLPQQEEMPSPGNVAALVAQVADTPRAAIAKESVNTAEAQDDAPLVTDASVNVDAAEPARDKEERIYEPPFPAYAPVPVDSWTLGEDEGGRTSRGSSFSLSVGGSSGARTALRRDAAMFACDDATVLKADPENWSSGYTLHRSAGEYHWGISWRMNALVEKYITDRISVGTGLSWTMVEGTMEYDLDNAQVQYVGVPAVISVDLVDNGSFAVTASAGGTAAYGVSSSSTVPVNPFQLSSQVTLNARYRLYRNLALQMGIGADTFYPAGRQSTSIFAEPSTVLNANMGLILLMH